MAIYHLSVKPVRRSHGRSSTAAAAYRAGCEIEDDRTGLTHNYTNKSGVGHTEIITPDGVDIPNRSDLWNMVEKAEKRKDSCTAREYEVNLPYELNDQQRTNLAQDFSRQLAKIHGIAVDLCIHKPTDKEIARGADPRNHHAHILTTTRKITNNGLTDKADIEKSGRKRKDDLRATRELWADTANRHLEMAGLEQRIDSRSLIAQGSELIPTIKMGKNATQMERESLYTPKGKNPRLEYQTKKGDINRAIKLQNDIHELLGEVLNEKRDTADRAIISSERAIADGKRVIANNSINSKKLANRIENTARAISSIVRADGTVTLRVDEGRQGIADGKQVIADGKQSIIREGGNIEWGNREIENRLEQKRIEGVRKTQIAIGNRTPFDLINVRIKLTVTALGQYRADPKLSGDVPIGSHLDSVLRLMKQGYKITVGHGNNSHIKNNPVAEHIQDFMMKSLQKEKVVLDYNNLAIRDFTVKYGIECDLNTLKTLHEQNPVVELETPQQRPDRRVEPFVSEPTQPKHNDDYDFGI